MSGSAPDADNDEFRGWKKNGREKFWAIRKDPMALPLLLKWAIDPFAWSGKSAWANPVTMRGKTSPQISRETTARRSAGP